MAEDFGKITRDFFDTNIKPKLGRNRKEVIVPPRNGVDIGVIRIGPNRVMAITTDPFYIVPPYGWERAAWFAFHIIASDLCTTGLPPEYFAVDLNLPLSITDDEFKILWNTVDREAKKYGVSIVTGHTARYEGTNYPMVGGATMFGTGPEDNYVTSAMAEKGDTVVITKTAALEATAIFSMLYPEHISSHLGPATLRGGEGLFYKMSTVDESMIASSFGLRKKGVTAMHDATEGGVLGALYEIAEASGRGILVDIEKIPVNPEVAKICELFGMRPLHSISEGTLVMTVKKDRVESLLSLLKSKGIDATEAGTITDIREGKKVREGGKTEELPPPGKDDFWKAIHQATEAGLK
jgi:hydrogenase expression/formation protein HypE